jgi:hypothetical protein
MKIIKQILELGIVLVFNAIAPAPVAFLRVPF